MSVQLITYFQGEEIEGVENKEGIEVELNYDRDKDNVIQETNISTLKFAGKNGEINDKLLEYVNGGITGTTHGVFEGPAFRLDLVRGSTVDTLFDGYVDLVENHTLSVPESEIVVKEKNSVDFLNDVVDGFTFEYLKDIGEITEADYTWVPYILNSVPDYMQAALSVVSVYVIAEQIKSVIEEIKHIATEMANVFEAVTSILKMILLIVYLIALFISIVKLIKDVVQLLIQPVKYHACMSFKTLLQKGAAHLGYTFECAFFDDPRWSRLYIMPEKLRVPRNTTDNRLLGYFNPGNIEQFGYFKGSYGDLMRAAKIFFKGKYVVTPDNKIVLLRRDQGMGTPEYQLANEGDSDYYQPQYSLNTGELVANYLIKFQYDVTDKNTIQEYKGTELQVITDMISSSDPKRKLLKGLNVSGNIPFALAKRKEELTIPEQILKAFLDVFSDLMNVLIDAVNVVISVYNTIVTVINKIIKALKVVGIKVDWEIKTIDPLEPVELGNLIENRIGMLKIECDNFAVPKIMLLNVSSNPKYTKLDPSNATILTARNLWDNFHFIDSFVPRPGRPYGNQCKFVPYKDIPFTFTSYQQVKRNNMIYDYTGNQLELVTLKYNPFLNKASEVLVRVPYLYTKNLKETLIEPDGT